jgi:hypothetical protein
MDIILFVSVKQSYEDSLLKSFLRGYCDRWIVKFYGSIIDKESVKIRNNRYFFMLIREMTSNVTVYL